jgi:hypothetical protein
VAGKKENRKKNQLHAMALLSQLCDFPLKKKDYGTYSREAIP